MTVAQCDAMLCLYDDEFFSRAWCAVEVLMLQTLEDSYGYHKRWEHHLIDPTNDPIRGRLVQHNRLQEVRRIEEDDHSFRLSREVEDRPTVRFLARQTRILAKPV